MQFYLPWAVGKWHMANPEVQSIGHPHPKPIKLRQAGWPLLSMCICCSGVMNTLVVSGCHWGSQWVPYATEEHTAIWHFLQSLRGCWYQYLGSLIIRNTHRVLMHGHQGWNIRHGFTVCVTFTWDMYIYIWDVYSLCFFCCLFITVTWWYVWCIEWTSGNQEEVQACLVTLWLFIISCYSLYKTTLGLLSGEPDYFGRNKISSGGDLSHYSSASLY